MKELQSYMLENEILEKECLTKEELEKLDKNKLPKGVFHDSEAYGDRRYYRIIYKGDGNPYDDLKHITYMEVGKTCSTIRNFILFQLICFIIAIILIIALK